MRDATAQSESRSPRPEHGYAVRILEQPEIGPHGLRHLDGDASRRLDWDRVRLALAAEIGEPEGVRTIVFDLIADGGGERGWLAHRLDAEPGAEAMRCARELSEWLPPEACGPSIKSLATDGIPSRWYPDLASFEEEAIELLRPSG
jgi:hypothetical protein